MSDTTILNLIEEAKTVVNINKLLPARSKKPIHVALRFEIMNRTQFLPTDADLRERLWYIEHNATVPPMCSHCNTNPVSWDYTYKAFRQYCSPTCVGDSVDVKKRKVLTCKANLGVDFPAQSSEVRQKYTSTMTERYGVPYVNQTNIVMSGARDQLSDYDTMNHLTHEDQMSTFDIADMFGVSQATASKYRSRLNIEPRASSISSLQRDVVSFIRTFYDGEIITNTRSVIAPKEIDVYLPEKNLAFEINGTYWHSEVSGKKHKNYHIEKTNAAKKVGVRLYHIFEPDLKHRLTATQSRIRSLVGGNSKLGARKTTCKRISSADARAFTDVCHTQGSVNCSLAYGLFVGEELVSCMTFGKGRYSNFQWELLRFCSKPGLTIAGGGSKMLTMFKHENNPTSIVSYCDLRWGVGSSYSQMGFTLSHRSSPNYWYFKMPSHVLHSRVQYQKHKLASKLESFDANLSEWANMQINGFDRIWDCGNDVWTWESTLRTTTNDNVNVHSCS